MQRRVWTFVLDGEPHEVMMEYNVFTPWERLTLDGQVLFEGHRWTLVSRYDFTIGGHACRATFNSPMYQLGVTVDETPCELLPSNALLRPASGDSETLVRPSQASGAQTSEPETLLRPAAEETDADASEPVV